MDRRKLLISGLSFSFVLMVGKKIFTGTKPVTQPETESTPGYKSLVGYMDASNFGDNTGVISLWSDGTWDHYDPRGLMAAMQERGVEPKMTPVTKAAFKPARLLAGDAQVG